MPTSTFFRLPEEKQQRLKEACRAELTQVRFTDFSINRIIAAAHIPRGSFYQYFEDKEDLIRYFLEDMREYFILLLQSILEEEKGDLFALPLAAYDHFVRQSGDTDPMLELCIKILRLNKGIDFQSFIGGPQHFLPDQLWEKVDPSRLRQNDRNYADHVFHMACAALALAVMESLCEQIEGPPPREALQIRMDMLRYGGASDNYKEGNT